MKKAIAVALSVLIIAFVFAGCGEDLYYNYDMTEYVSVGDYSNKVDRNSTKYIDAVHNYYEEIFGTDLNYEAFVGIVEYGDIVNISYEGYVEGKTFLYGTGINFELKIGSGTFTVEGFEDGLIGAKIGETTVLNLTMPKNFSNDEVAGKAVVFEIVINSATKAAEPTNEIAVEYGFSSYNDYLEKADRYAVGVCLFHTMFEATTFKDYPETEFNLLYDEAYNAFKELCRQNGTSVSKYLSDYGITSEDLEKDIAENEVKPAIDVYLLSYYIIQTNGEKLTKQDVNAKREKLVSKYGDNLEKIGFSKINIEQAAAYDKAIDLLYSKAKILN